MTLSEQYGLDVDPRARSGSSPSASSSGWRSSVCSISARILVFDEPTAVLTPQEARNLLQTLRGMAAQGFSVVFISHKLDEVLEVADRVSVLRRGQIVATTTPPKPTAARWPGSWLDASWPVLSSIPPTSRMRS